MLPKLSQIAPKWAKALKKHSLVYYQYHSSVDFEGASLELGNPACCIVGEAHNHDPDFRSCSVCYRFSQGLYFWNRGASSDTESFNSQFKTEKDMINAFIIHFMEAHKK